MSFFRFVSPDSSRDVRRGSFQRCSQCKDVLFGIKTAEMATGMIVNLAFHK